MHLKSGQIFRPFSYARYSARYRTRYRYLAWLLDIWPNPCYKKWSDTSSYVLCSKLFWKPSAMGKRCFGVTGVYWKKCCLTTWFLPFRLVLLQVFLKFYINNVTDPDCKVPVLLFCTIIQRAYYFYKNLKTKNFIQAVFYVQCTKDLQKTKYVCST